MLNKESVIESLRQVLDPEIGISIVDLNMVRDIYINGDDVKVQIALTVAHCPLAKTLQSDVEKALKKTGQVKTVTVDTTAMTKQELEQLRTRLQNQTHAPQQQQQRTSVGAGIERLGKREIRNIIAVASGKGGVGKSFVTGTLATHLQRQGYKVGVLDADLTGPSIAKIFGVTGAPTKTPAGLIRPVETRSGIKIMSINLVLDDPSQPVIWRGPIVNSVIRQLYWDVDWGPLHYLLVDLPPGCVTADTIVYANPHPRRVDEIKPGDHVYSLDASISRSGRYPNVMNAKILRKRVLSVVPQGETEVFELRSKTRRIRGTYNHPVLALEKTRTEGRREYKLSLKWKRLTELRRGDIIAVAKKLPETEEVFELPKIAYADTRDPTLPSRATEDFCRIIGYFIGDGFLRISPRSRTYQVMFAEPRQGRFRRKYIELLEAVFPGVKVYEDDNQFGILSRRITYLFKELELDKSALNKRAPPWIFKLSSSKKEAFIEGYCDADGYRRPAKTSHQRPGWMVFESPNRWLLEDIRVLSISLGLRVTNLNSRQRILRPPSGKTYASTFWSFEGTSTTRSSKYGAGMIRGNGREAVGRGLANEHIGFERVSSVKHAGRSQVYDLEVEGNQNFLAEGLVVHNTSDAPLTVFQSLPLDGVIVVSSPQDLAKLIVTKAVNMAKKMNAELLGLVENMSYLECPHCHERIDVYGKPQGERLAKELGIQYLGSVPIDPQIAQKSDEGRIEDYVSPALETITDKLRLRTSEQVQQLMQGLPIAWSAEPAKG